MRRKRQFAIIHAFVIGLLTMTVLFISLRPTTAHAYDTAKHPYYYLENDVWDFMPNTVKKDVLEHVVTFYSADLGLRTVPSLSFFYEEPVLLDGIEILSHGYRTNNSIYLNLYCADDPYDLFLTIAHELRHCWQHEFVDYEEWYVGNHKIAGIEYNNTYVNTNRERMTASIDNYQTSDSIGYQEYRNQLIERDARWYERQIGYDIEAHLELAEKYTMSHLSIYNKQIPRYSASSLLEAYEYQKYWQSLYC